jgi:hypothetical protein
MDLVSGLITRSAKTCGGTYMKSTVAMKSAKKKITIRKVGDVRLTSAICNTPYHISAA